MNQQNAVDQLASRFNGGVATTKASGILSTKKVGAPATKATTWQVYTEVLVTNYIALKISNAARCHFDKKRTLSFKRQVFWQ